MMMRRRFGNEEEEEDSEEELEEGLKLRNSSFKEEMNFISRHTSVCLFFF